VPVTCHDASGWERLVDYYAGELTDPDASALEDHWSGCASCADAAASIATLVSHTRDLVANGWGLWAITPALLERLRDRGLRIREATAFPGDALHLRDTVDIDLLIGRLQGDFSGLDRVDVAFESEVDFPTIIERDVPLVSPNEILIACVLHLRSAPGTRIRTRCVLRQGEGVIAAYGLAIDVTEPSGAVKDT
jgi:hypothetical protein